MNPREVVLQSAMDFQQEGFQEQQHQVFKTSGSRPIYSSWSYAFKTSLRRFQDVFKTSCLDPFKTPSRRLQDVLQKCLQDMFETSSDVSQKRLQDIFKTSSRCFEGVFKTSCKDIFKTFPRCIIELNCSC